MAVIPPNAAETVIESTGHLYVAALGTAFPTAFAAPIDPWVDVGHTSTDGPRPSGFERDAERFYSWQQPKIAIRSVPGTAEPQFLVDLLQVNGNTLKLYFGGGTITPGTAPAPSVFVPPLADPVEQALVVDWFDGANQYRWCVKRTVPIAGGEVALASGELAMWPVRFDVLAPTDGTAWGEIRYPGGAVLLGAEAAEAETEPTPEPVG